MLEYLKGSITQIGDSFIVVETGGIGIKVITTRAAIEKFKKLEEKVVQLPTYLHISENKWEIFGFDDDKEREAFLLLLECRGVGTKAALNIMNSFSPGRLRRIALGEEPVTVLQQAPGIGAKSAERILVELKEKLPAMGNWEEGNRKREKSSTEYSREDLYRVLKNLGYREAEIHRAISQLSDLPSTLSEAVKQMLRTLGR